MYRERAGGQRRLPTRVSNVLGMGFLNSWQCIVLRRCFMQTDLAIPNGGTRSTNCEQAESASTTQSGPSQPDASVQKV